MAGLKVPEDVRTWLKNLPQHGMLARISRQTGIPSPTLTKIKHRHQETLDREEWKALVDEHQRYANTEPSPLATVAPEEVAFPASDAFSKGRRQEFDDPAIKLHSEYPDQLNKDLALAHVLRVSGSTLRRLERRRKQIRDVLSRKGSVQVIFVDPAQQALCRYEAIQELGRDDPEAIAEFMNILNRNAKWWFDLKSANVEIRKIDYPLAFGLDVINFKNGGGSVYVRSYPLTMSGEEEDTPILELRDNNIWYPFYTEQFERHWKRASKWRPEEAPK